MNIVGNEDAHQPHLHLLVGIAKCVELHDWVIILNGDVTALIEQRQDGLHVLRRLVKVGSPHLTAIDLCDVGVEVLEHVDQKCWCTRGEPVMVEFAVVHRREQAEGIQNALAVLREMIAVVMIEELVNDLLMAVVVFLCQHTDSLLEVVFQLLYCYAAHSRILRQHRDVVQVIELREDAELRELRDACDEDETEVGIEILQRRIKRLQLRAHLLEVIVVMEHGEQRRIVLVDEDDDLRTRLLV